HASASAPARSERRVMRASKRTSHATRAQSPRNCRPAAAPHGPGARGGDSRPRCRAAVYTPPAGAPAAASESRGMRVGAELAQPPRMKSFARLAIPLLLSGCLGGAPAANGGPTGDGGGANTDLLGRPSGGDLAGAPDGGALDGAAPDGGGVTTEYAPYFYTWGWGSNA